MPHGKHAPGTITPNISVDRTLWGEARAKAASQGLGMSAVVRALLRRWLDGEVALGGDGK